jgi:hypothetical protein
LSENHNSAQTTIVRAGLIQTPQVERAIEPSKAPPEKQAISQPSPC